MTNPKLQALTDRATTALTGKPAWGHTLVVDFGSDGVLCVYPQNQVVAIPNANVSADCTLHLKGISVLEDIESKKETPTAEWWSGNLSWDGDRSIAEKFVAIIQGAK